MNAAVGTTYQLTATSTVTIIDPYDEYVTVLKQCFDFDALKVFMVDRPDVSIVFDGMHGAGGPFARRVLVDELGLPEVRIEDGQGLGSYVCLYTALTHTFFLSRI